MIEQIIEAPFWILAVILVVGFLVGLLPNKRMAITVLLVIGAALHFRMDTLPAGVEFINAAAKKLSIFDNEHTINHPELPIVVLKPGWYEVNVEALNVRVQPNFDGQHVITLSSGEVVNVRSMIAGWAQISDEFIGIRFGDSGNLSLWARANYLKPAEISSPLITTPDIFSAIAQSENIIEHSSLMIEQTRFLIENGDCVIEDFYNNLDWSKNSDKEYFTICASEGGSLFKIDVN